MGDEVFVAVAVSVGVGDGDGVDVGISDGVGGGVSDDVGEGRRVGVTVSAAVRVAGRVVFAGATTCVGANVPCPEIDSGVSEAWQAVIPIPMRMAIQITGLQIGLFAHFSIDYSQNRQSSLAQEDTQDEQRKGNDQ